MAQDCIYETEVKVRFACMQNKTPTLLPRTWKKIRQTVKCCCTRTGHQKVTLTVTTVKKSTSKICNIPINQKHYRICAGGLMKQKCNSSVTINKDVLGKKGEAF